MIRSSAALVAVAVAGSVGFVAAELGCTSLIATANGAGLGELTGALDAAATSLLQTEAGPLILAANLDVDLPDAQRGTVFAPTDAAFAAAAEKFGGELPQDALADVLLNHIVAQELTAATITSELGDAGGSIVLQSVLGSELFVSTDGTDIFVQSPGLEAPGAKVIEVDQITCAGPVHVIDAVLLPEMPDGTVVELGETAVELVVAPPVEAPPAAVEPAVEPVLSANEPASEMPSAAPSTTERSFTPPLYDYDYDGAAMEPLGDEPTEGPAMSPVGDEPTEGPAIAPLGDEPAEGPSNTTLGDEAAEVEAPMEVIDAGVEPSEGPSLAPMGDEPAEGPSASDPLTEADEGSEGFEEAGDAAEAATSGGAPTVQGETDAAFSPAALASTAAAVAAAVLVLVA